MRLELLWNWRLLCERLAVESERRRRLGRLRHTPAEGLQLRYIDSLELLEVAREAGIATIYDIGANLGTWSLLAKAVIPGARVEAFEPLPAHHAGFMRRCEGLAGVNLHRIALGAANGIANLRVTDFSDASSFLPMTDASRRLFGLEEAGQVATEVRRLDDYQAEKGLPPPDLMKLDVQGFELEVLKGSTRQLRAAKALIVEVSFVELYERQCMFPEVSGFLDQHGFSVHAFGVTTPLGKPLVQADILFLRR